jgi:hypothetical protein
MLRMTGDFQDIPSNSVQDAGTTCTISKKSLSPGLPAVV